jgi:hypothetical protein
VHKRFQSDAENRKKHKEKQKHVEKQRNPMTTFLLPTKSTSAECTSANKETRPAAPNSEISACENKQNERAENEIHFSSIEISLTVTVLAIEQEAKLLTDNEQCKDATSRKKMSQTKI